MSATLSDDGFDDEIGWRRQNDHVHSIDRAGSDDPRRRRHKSPSEKTVVHIKKKKKIATNGQRLSPCTVRSYVIITL